MFFLNKISLDNSLTPYAHIYSIWFFVILILYKNIGNISKQILVRILLTQFYIKLCYDFSICIQNTQPYYDILLSSLQNIGYYFSIWVFKTIPCHAFSYLTCIQQLVVSLATNLLSEKNLNPIVNSYGMRKICITPNN